MEPEALTKEQRGALKRVMMSDDFDIILTMIDKQIHKWSVEPSGGNTEFEVVRAVYKKEGKIEGLKEFFDKLEEEVQ